jgi:hypothetical protein
MFKVTGPLASSPQAAFAITLKEWRRRNPLVRALPLFSRVLDQQS